MKTLRYAVPQFYGQHTVEFCATSIDETLKAHAAYNIRIDKARGCTTFRLLASTNWDALCVALAAIHPNCVAISYKNPKEISEFQRPRIQKYINEVNAKDRA